MRPADPGEGSSRGAAGNSGAGRSGGDGFEQTPAPREGEGEGSTPRALSRYALDYGSRHDGMVGMVLYEAQAPADIDGLHQQVVEQLGLTPESPAADDVRAQLTESLNLSEISENLTGVRSGGGHRVTVTVDGAERTVDVRMRQTDPRLNERAGTSGEVPRKTKVERTGDGGQTSSSSQDSGTVRTVPVPWIAIYEGPQGPLRWFDGTLSVSVTHNQLSQSVTVSEGVSTKTVQRTGDAAHAVDYTSRWQVRADADSNPRADWGPERAQGTVTVWFPEHRAFAPTGDQGPMPQPAGLDGLPLWGVEGVVEPARLRAEILGHEDFADLNGLGEDSREDLTEFLSERMLRGSVPMQRDNGVYSPVLYGAGGGAVGVVRIAARLVPRAPSDRVPDGFSLESWRTHSSGVDQSVRLTSGIGVDGSGGPMFTPDTAAGHPTAGTLHGGGFFGKAGVSWSPYDGLNTGSSSSLMHGLYTTSGHLVVPADITYDVTFIPAGGGEITHSFGPWEEGIELRLPPREITEGHVPTEAETRRAPAHLENVESIGQTAVPVGVEGTEEMFDRADRHLRQEGFLPSRERGGSGSSEKRRRAQLENLRRFEQLRSGIGQDTALTDAVDGGRRAWFQLPGGVAGQRNVQLRFTAGP
ncbi:hypothetical protein ACFU99_40875, partial [Streptomyces sp. NPDC057654]|uniref:hypothetical protein n=1 Tax=Streptomyces sp. NPDC057654 TaxID=3346196 RepID=UPI00368D1CD9